MTIELPLAVPPTPRRRPARGRVTRWVILAAFGLYFIGPLIAALSFTLQDPRGGLTIEAYRQIFAKPATGQISFASALWYSLGIAAVTIVITLGLMLPTQLLLHLRLPRWRGLVEAISLLPLVFPPVVLVVGVSNVYAWAQPSGTAGAGQQESPVFSVLKFIRADNHPVLLSLLYVMLALPYVYRALDTGIRAAGVGTLVEAARNLGAGWGRLVLLVLVPALRTALINAGFLCFALVMGEYTVASILLYTKPFPVWLAQLPTTSGQVQAAVSVFSLILVELLLLLIGALNWRQPTERRA